MQDGEQVFYTVNETNGKALIGNFAAGEQSEFHLIVREQAGYILDHIELEGPSGQYEFTRAQLTNSSCPEKGQNNIYVSWDDITHDGMTAEQLSAFRQSFKQLVPGQNYYITAYYTTRVIHVSAREITYEEFQRIEEEEEGGFSQYVRTHTVGTYHDPGRVADVLIMCQAQNTPIWSATAIPLPFPTRTCSPRKTALRPTRTASVSA